MLRHATEYNPYSLSLRLAYVQAQPTVKLATAAGLSALRTFTQHAQFGVSRQVGG